MKVFLLALMLVASAGGACPSNYKTIGFENNNPSNLSVGRCKWQSACGQDAWGHLRFATPTQGLDALRKTLATYKRKYRIHSIEHLCGRWISPKASALDHRQWIRVVYQRSGFVPGRRLDFTNPDTALKLAKGIIWAENGYDQYSDALYRGVFLGETEWALISQ